VLLVEDNPADALIVRQTLGNGHDARVEHVQTLTDAMSRLETGGIDVVLLDLGLPDSQGLGTFSAFHARWRDTPVVVLSGMKHDDVGLVAVKEGAEDFLSKDDLNRPLLERALYYAVERKQLKVALLQHERRHSQELERQVTERTALAEKRTAQLREMSRALAQSEQRERQRIARFIHDGLQQLLVTASMNLGRAARQSPDEQHQSIDRVQEIIRQAIAMSRSLTAQLSPAVLFETGLSRALEWLARNMRVDHDLVVALDVPEDLPQLPHDVATVVFESVRELLFNVVKHGRTHDASVGARVVGRRLEVVVRDGGVGFDPRELEQSSEHFGLRNVQHRLHLIDGDLHIQAAPGRGVQVTLTVLLDAAHAGSPAAPQPAAEPAPEPAPAPAPEPVLAAAPRQGSEPNSGPERRDIRVLVVDDHRIFRQGLIEMLMHSGCQDVLNIVGQADSGEAAVDQALELRPDVVLMDINLPGINGMEATRRILRLLPRTRVIGLSLHERDDMARAMRDAGAIAYLSKTGGIDQLVDTICDSPSRKIQK
jgi:signal transduction histidine kinase